MMNSEERPEPTVPEALASSGGAGAVPITVSQAMRRAVRNYWWKILMIWGGLTGILFVVIQERVKPIYESSSLLRVEPANRDLFNLGPNSAEDFDHVLQTQVELIRSANVLSATLAERNVAVTALVREAKHPESELRERLQVVVLGGTYLIRVALTSQERGDGPVIVNEVVSRYLNVVTDWSEKKNKFQIDRLKDYRDDLNDRIARQEKIWLGMAEEAAEKQIKSLRPMVPGADRLNLPPGKRQVSLDEYRQIRERLFETNMKVIETEALLKHRMAELSARDAGIDPELLAQKRIKDALRKDPEIASLTKEIEQVQRIFALPRYQTGGPTDPAPVQASGRLEAKKQDLRDLISRKQEELALMNADGDATLRELNEQVDTLKVRMSSYETLQSQVEVTSPKEGTSAARMALAREDLASLREMRATVEKRIEQLEFDSRGEARIQQIEKARPGEVPIKDIRRKLWAITPVVLLPLVLGLFLIVELRSGRVAARDEGKPKKPVDEDRLS